MKNKLFVLIVLFMVVIGLSMGSVSAKSTTKKYKDWCHGGDIKHKATWTKKYDEKEYVGTVYKNGHKYKKYVKLYIFTCICKKTKYHKPWLEAHPGDKYYSYETYSSGSHEKYVYKKIGKSKKKSSKTHVYKKTGKSKKKSSKSYVASINSNKFHYSSCRSAKIIKSYNKIKFSSRSDAINQGYSPCKSCHP